ncbi:uncharacterized protein Z519_01676 [Cladophialophora bantiana CBS 173.52]|uniref:Copper transporter n=1 Tax=Cladophialophora bantiana (strain ATCC 10958 / CBS 173.52 / CDC B-1940 / NIH 8579) TaxID=1442370 RepID=A0A0D2GIA4_CLAB1|nr:uncharacterized protein Z519_01676 [Cladophialophora bantiana CBS 173.52]KIW98092.1 hypothetical protein Z519_01676 [Cladophialophora bantiana CBS 173.52]
MPVSTRQSVRPKHISTEPLSSNTLSPSQSSLFSRLLVMNMYKLTAALLIFFATTHTIGGLLLPNDFGVEGNALFSAMQTVRFNFMGRLRTLHDFYMGFGLGATVFLSMSAALSWVLSAHPTTTGHTMALRFAPRSEPKGEAKRADDGDGNAATRGQEGMRLEELLSTLKWILFLSNFVNMLLCYVYFFVPPMVVSTVIAALLGLECLKDWIH